jgi:hypothetical protein
MATAICLVLLLDRPSSRSGPLEGQSAREDVLSVVVVANPAAGVVLAAPPSDAPGGPSAGPLTSAGRSLGRADVPEPDPARRNSRNPPCTGSASEWTTGELRELWLLLEAANSDNTQEPNACVLPTAFCLTKKVSDLCKILALAEGSDQPYRETLDTEAP